ncbi:MAG: hypothetical protein IJZ79_06365 [Bacilli bacterium]|nr:hypothetical protein [Bacilli bacterium]
MPYYLTVEVSKGKYLKLPIDKLQEKGLFYRTSRFVSETLCSLEEIDMFTTQFYNEFELRKTLIENGILPTNLANKRLSIRYNSEGEFKKVMYDLLYQKDIEFILEPQRIINMVYQRFMSGEYDFIKKIFNHFKEHHDCSSTAPEILYMINDTLLYNRLNPHFFEKDKNGDEIIIRGLKLLIYVYSEKSGKIKYTNKIKYRNLHDLIALINDYDLKQQKEKDSTIFDLVGNNQVDNTNSIKTVIEETEVTEEIEEEIDPDKYIFEDEPVFGKDEVFGIEPSKETSKTKKRIKKIMPNQTSMFD